MRFTRLQLFLIGVSIFVVIMGVFSGSKGNTDIAVDSGLAAASSGTPVAYSYEPIRKKAVVPAGGKTSKPVSGSVNINSAGMDELMSLPRVGKKTAAAIIEYRKKHGPFKSVEELVVIKGIGRKTVMRFRELAYAGSPGKDTGEVKDSEKQSMPGANGGVAPGNGAARKQDIPSKTASKQSSACGPGMIDINTASKEELISLPRIGPVTAEKIIRYRREHGPFPSVDALVKVKGIGPKTLNRIRDRICTGSR